jgi:hypothetical protein
MTVSPAPDEDARIHAWITAVVRRHSANLTTQELARAIRALSARYVERRGDIGDRSPVDSAGKRAAFAAFYAPLHFLTVRQIVAALGSTRVLRHILDLGCGTGVASAAWALGLAPSPKIVGVETLGWAGTEAQWNWRALGLRGRIRRSDFVEEVSHARMSGAGSGIIAAWSVNELSSDARDRVLPRLLTCVGAGAAVLIVEPLAHAAAPWWDDWSAAIRHAGGRADAWKFAADLPPALAELDRAAGFDRGELGARSLWISR